MPNQNVIYKVNDDSVRIIFAEPIRELPGGLFAAMGQYRGSQVLVDGEDDLVVGIECKPSVWAEFLELHGKKLGAWPMAEFKQIIRELGMSLDDDERWQPR